MPTTHHAAFETNKLNAQFRMKQHSRLDTVMRNVVYSYPNVVYI